MHLKMKIGAVSLLLAGATDALANQPMDYDAYGGNMAIKGKATGFFHLEEIKGRHFLITPEGYGYRALGINHFHKMTSTDYDEAIRNIKSWGFNAGCYQGPQWMWDRYPYTKGINLVPVCQWKPDHQFGFKDVFDPEVLSEMHDMIRGIVEPQKDNAMLIGYFLTDIPMWQRKRNGEDWISFYKSLPAESPGGQVWVEWKANNPGQKEGDFLAVIARQLYAKGHEFIRKFDTNHLILGDRYHEKVDMPEIVVREALPYIDAIAVQPTVQEFDAAMYDGYYKKYGKPIYIADHVSSFATAEFPKTMGQKAKDPDSYVAYYTRYVTAALSHPHIVGFNKCQYQDEIAPSGILKQGILRRDGTPYSTVDGIKAANSKALKAAYTMDNNGPRP
jgi:hypothetical protein